MKLSDKFVSVVFWHAHKCPAHDDKFHLDRPQLVLEAYTLELCDSPCRRYAPSSSAVPPVLESVRTDRTSRGWRAY